MSLPALGRHRDGGRYQRQITQRSDNHCCGDSPRDTDSHGQGGRQHAAGTVDSPEPGSRLAIHPSYKPHACRKSPPHQHPSRSDDEYRPQGTHRNQSAARLAIQSSWVLPSRNIAVTSISTGPQGVHLLQVMARATACDTKRACKICRRPPIRG